MPRSRARGADRRRGEDLRRRRRIGLRVEADRLAGVDGLARRPAAARRCGVDALGVAGIGARLGAPSSPAALAAVACGGRRCSAIACLELGTLLDQAVGERDLVVTLAVGRRPRRRRTGGARFAFGLDHHQHRADRDLVADLAGHLRAPCRRPGSPSRPSPCRSSCRRAAGPRSTSSPTLTCQATISASAMPSPMSGSLNSKRAMTPSPPKLS